MIRDQMSEVIVKRFDAALSLHVFNPKQLTDDADQHAKELRLLGQTVLKDTERASNCDKLASARSVKTKTNRVKFRVSKNKSYPPPLFVDANQNEKGDSLQKQAQEPAQQSKNKTADAAKNNKKDASSTSMDKTWRCSDCSSFCAQDSFHCPSCESDHNSNTNNSSDKLVSIGKRANDSRGELQYGATSSTFRKNAPNNQNKVVVTKIVPQPPALLKREESTTYVPPSHPTSPLETRDSGDSMCVKSSEVLPVRNSAAGSALLSQQREFERHRLHREEWTSVERIQHTNAWICAMCLQQNLDSARICAACSTWRADVKPNSNNYWSMNNLWSALCSMGNTFFSHSSDQSSLQSAARANHLQDHRRRIPVTGAPVVIHTRPPVPSVSPARIIATRYSPAEHHAHTLIGGGGIRSERGQQGGNESNCRTECAATSREFGYYLVQSHPPPVNATQTTRSFDRCVGGAISRESRQRTSDDETFPPPSVPTDSQGVSYTPHRPPPPPPPPYSQQNKSRLLRGGRTYHADQQVGSFVDQRVVSTADSRVQFMTTSTSTTSRVTAQTEFVLAHKPHEHEFASRQSDTWENTPNRRNCTTVESYYQPAHLKAPLPRPQGGVHSVRGAFTRDSTAAGSSSHHYSYNMTDYTLGHVHRTQMSPMHSMPISSNVPIRAPNVPQSNPIVWK
eukprot:gene21283-27306_t